MCGRHCRENLCGAKKTQNNVVFLFEVEASFMHPGSSPNTSGCATPKARIQTPSLADLLASIRTMVAIPFRNAKNIPQIGTNHEGIVST
jgi:hypothetical protein